MHGHGHRLHRLLPRLLAPTAAGVDEGRVGVGWSVLETRKAKLKGRGRVGGHPFDATYDHLDLDLG